jgi:predicted dehydrogenase
MPRTNHTPPVGISLVGVGYWGPNLLRNISSLPNAKLQYVCDLDEERLKQIKRLYPSVKTTKDITDLAKDKDTDAVFVATPVRTHYPLAKMLLENKKHVLVEKPMADSVVHAEELVQLANKNKLTLMVDHTFIYTPAVQKMKKLVETKELGDLFYFDSVRANLGLFQNDVNVLWDLATHDLAIMDYVLGQDPLEVRAIGASHIRKDMHNIVYVTVRYPGNLLGHIHVNWLAPVKLRLTILSGYNKMVSYNDLEPVEKIKIYDRSITYKQDLNNVNLSKYQYRVGDINSPRLDDVEALHGLVVHFIHSIQNKTKPITDGLAGLRIVTLLEAAQKSLDTNGVPVPVSLKNL